MDFSLDTSEKIISVVVGAIAIVTFVYKRFFAPRGSATTAPLSGPVSSAASANGTNTNTNNVTVTVSPPSSPHQAATAVDLGKTRDVATLKRNVRVLFIDDDKGFKTVGVLKKMGWEHTKTVTDITSLEQLALSEAHVVFVDIQGVGKAMRYAEEGLGLAQAIKRRYPEKKVIIYSAQEEGERFHQALQEADYNLPKTAEPIRFEDTIVRVLSDA
ncbi:hypothetical protein MX652_08605 [Thauera aromatica]|nr:hypothetical protein [Thauera aromatica]MCK2126747.1 hypothetical protein [Thauera aromatica]